MNNSLARTNPVRRHIIQSTAFTLIAAGLACYLLSGFGPVYQNWKIDLSFLIMPLLIYYVIRLISRLSGVLVYSRPGKVLPLLLNGAAFSFSGYLLLRDVMLLSRIPPLSRFQDFLSDFSKLAIFVVLMAIGYTLIKLVELLNRSRKEQLPAPLMSSIGYTILAIAIWRSLQVFSTYNEAFSGAGVVIGSAILTVAVSRLGAYGELLKPELAQDIFHWARSGAFSKFLIGGCVAAYIVFLRPIIYSHVQYAFLVEWILVCLAGWRILVAISGNLKKNHSIPYSEAPWARHVQRVNTISDEDFNKYILLQSDFIENGSRKDLLNYLNQLLTDNGLNGDEIYRRLESLLEYKDRKIPWYARGYWKRRIQMHNKAARRKALDLTIKELKLITNPARR